MSVRRSQRARGREGVGRGKSSKARPLRREERERERERERNLPPLSLCRQPNPNQATRGPRFVRYKLFARIPKLVLSPFRSPQPNSPAAGSFARQGSRPGSGAWAFPFCCWFSCVYSPWHTIYATRHLVSRLHSRLFFSFRLPSFYEVDSTKKKVIYINTKKKFRRFRGGGESKAAGNTHRKKAKMMRM